MNTLIATETEATLGFLDHLFAAERPAGVAFQLWNGVRWPDEQPRPATIVLKHPGALRAMLLPGTARGLGEAYLRDDFDVDGDIEQAMELATVLENRPAGWLTSLADYFHVHRLPGVPADRADGRAAPALNGREHSLDRDRQAISFHYDVSNDFYQLWLDERMVYSCGYFETPGVSLDQAQAAKLDLICRKLRLRPGQHLLDIGCGWGGLAIFAASRYGVKVTGVTLSERQVEEGRDRVRRAGLTETVRLELCDYREIHPPAGFDAIASVGMAEHVGRERLPGYFKAAGALLKPGGVFLNHAISEGLRADRFCGPSFVDRYVFPDADIPPLPVVVAAAAEAGLDVRDVENLREHYTLTLRHWVGRLEAAHDRALEFVNEPTYRVWRLYMAGSAHGFAHGDLALYQTLLSRPGPGGRAGLPLTRRDWFA